MSHVKHDQLTADGEWRRHLRPEGRRRYWKAERAAWEPEIEAQLAEKPVLHRRARRPKTAKTHPWAVMWTYTMLKKRASVWGRYKTRYEAVTVMRRQAIKIGGTWEVVGPE